MKWVTKTTSHNYIVDKVLPVSIIKVTEANFVNFPKYLVKTKTKQSKLFDVNKFYFMFRIIDFKVCDPIFISPIISGFKIILKEITLTKTMTKPFKSAKNDMLQD